MVLLAIGQQIFTIFIISVVCLTVSQNRTKTFRSDVQVIFTLRPIQIFSGSFIPNKPTFTKYSVDFKAPGIVEIHRVRLVNITGLVGIVNAMVSTTEPIFPGPNF